MAGFRCDSNEWLVVVVTARIGCAARPAVNSGLSSCCRSWRWKLWLLHYFFVPYLHEPIGLRASTDRRTSLCWLCQGRGRRLLLEEAAILFYFFVGAVSRLAWVLRLRPRVSSHLIFYTANYSFDLLFSLEFSSFFCSFSLIMSSDDDSRWSNSQVPLYLWDGSKVFKKRFVANLHRITFKTLFQKWRSTFASAIPDDVHVRLTESSNNNALGRPEQLRCQDHLFPLLLLLLRLHIFAVGILQEGILCHGVCPKPMYPKCLPGDHLLW